MVGSPVLVAFRFHDQHSITLKINVLIITIFYDRNHLTLNHIVILFFVFQALWKIILDKICMINPNDGINSTTSSYGYTLMAVWLYGHNIDLKAVDE
jgi:hypothetical protein